MRRVGKRRRCQAKGEPDRQTEKDTRMTGGTEVGTQAFALLNQSHGKE